MIFQRLRDKKNRPIDVSRSVRPLTSGYGIPDETTLSPDAMRLILYVIALSTPGQALYGAVRLKHHKNRGIPY
jgi:hypothetical protein